MFIATMMVIVKGPTEKAWVWRLEELVVLWDKRASPKVPCFGDRFLH